MFVVLDLCPVYPMLPVFLDCPFLIAPCVFSNVCCPAYPMLPVSLDCPFLIARSVFSIVCCPRLVSCVPYVVSFSDCPFLIAPCVFSIVCCPRLVSCVPYVASFSGLSISDCSLCILYRLLSSTCVLCTLCCQFLRIVNF